LWYVVYVRTAGEAVERIDSASLRSLADNINLAKELGAHVVRLEGDDVPAALASFARERRITHAVFGRTREPAWRERLRGSVVDRFMRLVPEVDVVVVGTAPEHGAEEEKG
jgi:two-component system sensor histidine kinase KdpD